MINGGHGQANIDYLNEHNIKYNIIKTYDNGVGVGNLSENVGAPYGEWDYCIQSSNSGTSNDYT